jgi:hypothetical protein
MTLDMWRLFQLYVTWWFGGEKKPETPEAQARKHIEDIGREKRAYETGKDLEAALKL